jgi:hypothetical protein
MVESLLPPMNKYGLISNMAKARCNLRPAGSPCIVFIVTLYLLFYIEVYLPALYASIFVVPACSFCLDYGKEVGYPNLTYKGNIKRNYFLCGQRQSLFPP